MIMKNKSLILIFTLFLIGASFRLYQLRNIPFGLNNDAAWEGSAALDILRGNSKPYLPYADEGWRGEGIVRVVIAFFALFLGSDQITIRAATTLFGIGLIIPLYLFLELLFDRKTAFLTAFFVSISGWHIIMSRSGWRAVSVPFFATLAFYFLFKGIKTLKTKDFIASGIMLSFASLYSYDAGRILPFLFVTTLFLLAVTAAHFWKMYASKLVLTSLIAFIVGLPMLFYAYKNWDNFISRSKFIYEYNLKNPFSTETTILSNIKTSALLFTHRANGNDFFINEPLIDKPVSWLFPVGFVIILLKTFKDKNKGYLFMLLWFLFSLLPGIFSLPNGNRAIGSIPSVYFFCALGLITITSLIEKIPLKKAYFLSTFTVVTFIGISTFQTHSTYFGPNRREIPGFYPETMIITSFIRTIWDEYEVYLTDNYPRELLTYYLYKDGYNPFYKNYTWLEDGHTFIATSRDESNTSGLSYKQISPEGNDPKRLNNQDKKKGKAFFMFANNRNEVTAQTLVSENPQAQKFYLWYENGKIRRPASLVVLLPPK